MMSPACFLNLGRPAKASGIGGHLIFLESYRHRYNRTVYLCHYEEFSVVLANSRPLYRLL